MHQWRAQPLGLRTDENMTDPNRIALLVRGQLLRRYPNTAVYAWKKRTTPANPDPESPDHTQLLKDAIGNPPNAAAIQQPVFAGVIPPDITFFGFDIDKQDVAKWCFVLEEQMSEPRFGFDVDVPAQGQPAPVKPQRSALRSALVQMAVPNNALLAGGYNAYKALSWSHVGVVAGRLREPGEADQRPEQAVRVLPDARGRCDRGRHREGAPATAVPRLLPRRRSLHVTEATCLCCG